MSERAMLNVVCNCFYWKLINFFPSHHQQRKHFLCANFMRTIFLCATHATYSMCVSLSMDRKNTNFLIIPRGTLVSLAIGFPHHFRNNTVVSAICYLIEAAAQLLSPNYYFLIVFVVAHMDHRWHHLSVCHRASYRRHQFYWYDGRR